MQLVIDISDDDYIKAEAGLYGCFGDMIIRGTPLPKGHGDIVDIETLIDMFWDGNYMEIHKDDLSTIEPIIKADKVESEDAKGAEITDAYQPAWETVLYVDTEHNLIVTKAQLFEEFKAMVDTGTIDDGTTFSDYLVNCTDKNGTLVRVK